MGQCIFMEPLTGYRCELPEKHEGGHRAIINASDEEGPLKERWWPLPGIHPDDWAKHAERNQLGKSITIVLGKRCEMPLIPGVIETFDKLKGLHKIKNDDYAGDKGAFYNFEISEYFISLFKGVRDKVYAGIIGIKIARLSVVLYKPPSNESVEDTFDDIITYTAIWKSDWVARNKPSIRQRVEETTVRETPEDKRV